MVLLIALRATELNENHYHHKRIVCRTGGNLIHVAIISHGHEELLIASALGGLLGAGDSLKVWVKDNRPSTKLRMYCADQDIFYTDARPGLGFGNNNNFLYDLIQEQVGFAAGDTFVIMNPDITILPGTILRLVAQMNRGACSIATINLYRDQNFSKSDQNIRHFPDISSILKIAFFQSVANVYDKNDILEPCHVDWASGAFLAFDATHYSTLNGFDSRYFMYFEDVDICYRSKLLGKQVKYYPDLKGIHAAAHKNRNIASKHAVWFFQSFIKFLSRRYFCFERRGFIHHVD
jgi:N-acetylglucosaminyl-diphospho-decaprenol L-rhamnosyltransferase